MDDRGGIHFILGMFVGALVGASVALLVTPQSGPQTREQIREKADDVKKMLEKYGKDFRDDAEEFIERGHKYVDEKSKKIRETLAQKKCCPAGAAEVDDEEAGVEV